MKTKLFTKNTYLGVLVAFVLSFGVQGIADALTFGTTRTGDFQTVLPSDDFKITFSVSLKSSSAVNKSTSKGTSTDIDYASGSRTRPAKSHPITSSYSVTADAGYSEGDTHYYVVTTKADVSKTDSDGSDVEGTVVRTTNTRNWVTEDAAYYYNQEQVTITATNDAVLKKVGSYDAPSNGILQEKGKDGSKLSSSMTLTFTAPATPNEVVITIADTRPDGDYPTGVNPATSLTFTVYVVKLESAVTTATLTLGDGTDIYTNTKAVGRSDQRDQPVAFTPSETSIPLEFKVEGGGQLYVREDARTTDRDKKSSSKTTLSTSSDAKVWLDMRGNTNKVTAWVSGTNPAVTGRSVIYIHGYAQLAVTEGNGQTGAPGGRLENVLGVKVTDSKNRVIRYPLIVRFPATGENDGNGEGGGSFIPFPGTTIFHDHDNNESTPRVKTLATATSPAAATVHEVYTDSSGIAKIYYQLNSNLTASGTYTITPGLKHATGVTTNFTFYTGTTGSGRVANLEIVSGNPQSATKGKNLKDPLVVIARSTAGYRIPDVIIQFRTNTGLLSRHGSTEKPADSIVGTLNPDSGQQIYVKTGSDGQASVNYNVGQLTVAREVVAEVRREQGVTQYDFAIDRVTFNINGSGGSGGGSADPQPEPQPANTITLSPLSISGAPGDTETLTISNPAGITVSLSGSGFEFSPPSGSATSFTSTVTLPSSTGSHTITAAGTIGGNTVSDTISVTVTAPGTLSAVQEGGQVVVSASPVPSSNLVFTLRTSGGVNAGSGEILPAGTGRAIPIVATGSHILTVSAEGYQSTQVSFTAGATGQQPTTTPTPTTPATGQVSGVAESIEIDGSRQRSGTLAQAIRLRVRVLDANDTGVSDVGVTFRVRAPGRGTFAGARGSGRAVRINTDRNGYATTNFTPTTEGDLIVEAKAAGVTAPVSFIIDVGEGTTPPPATTPGTGETPPTREIKPVVHVNKGSHPPMLWVDGGAIYALVDAEVSQKFISGVDNANNIAIGGGKVYWTERTGESGGTINSANLDGTGVKELTSILAVPMGIAVDTDASKLYWTNSRGRIQSANLDGSRITNVLENLSDPTDIALGDGHIYWTEDGDSIRRVNMTGTKVVKDVAVGLMDVGGIAVGGGKVYWTEATGASAGTINGANADGTQFKTLATIKAAPMGIAVDTGDQKLYWTNSRGRIQRANLNGSKIQNVVDGLISPSTLVIGGATQTTAAKPTTQPTETQRFPKKDTAKYDVNSDGSVDNVDASLVSGAMGTNTAKYDVNGDGTVNFLDLLLVFDNRDDDAAGAPTVLGMKLTAVQIDVIEEQIDLLIATGDRSPAAMRTLIYLQQLLATARPERTQLLANYPNPFNPETWIPYELADATQVKITIYNAQGVVIRTLSLGHQSAGYYTDRERAAYWDGRNALGEQVASGIYFYQLETDAMSSLRKMVILK